MAVRRFRHVLAVLLAIILVQVVVDDLRIVIGRPARVLSASSATGRTVPPLRSSRPFRCDCRRYGLTLVTEGSSTASQAFGLADVLVSALVLAARLSRGGPFNRSTIVSAIFSLCRCALSLIRGSPPRSDLPGHLAAGCHRPPRA